MAVNRAGPDARHAYDGCSSTHPGGCFEHLNTSVPQELGPTITPGAHGAAPGRTRHSTKGRAH
jgi:hypothetical protein